MAGLADLKGLSSNLDDSMKEKKLAKKLSKEL